MANQLNQLQAFQNQFQQHQNQFQQHINRQQAVRPTTILLHGYTVDRQNDAIERALASSIYNNVDQPLPMMNQPYTDHQWENDLVEAERKPRRDAFLAHKTKINASTDLAAWFGHFEYLCDLQRIPMSMRFTRITTSLLDTKLSAKFLSEMQQRGLNSYEALQQWLIKPRLVREEIRKAERSITSWKQTENSIGASFDEYYAIINEFIRHLRFALLNHIEVDDVERPREMKLVQQFVDRLYPQYKMLVYKTMKELEQRAENIKLLELVCRHVEIETAPKYNSSINDVYEQKPRKAETALWFDRGYNGNRGRGRGGYRGGHRGGYRGGYRGRGRRNFGNNRGRGKFGRGRGKGRPQHGDEHNERPKPKYRNERKHRNDKISKASKCYGCGRVGHHEHQCWEKHPHLKKQYFAKRRGNKRYGPRQMFVMKGEDLVPVDRDGQEIEDANEQMDQFEIFLMENDEFQFEGAETTDEQDNEDNGQTTDDATKSDDPDELDIHYWHPRR